MLRTALRRMRSGHEAYAHVARFCYSARAAERRCFQVWRSTSWRSRLKPSWTLAWTEANFYRQPIRLNRSVARSRRWSGRCEFSARLLAQRPTSSFTASRINSGDKLFRRNELGGKARDRRNIRSRLLEELARHRVKLRLAPVLDSQRSLSCSQNRPSVHLGRIVGLCSVPLPERHSAVRRRRLRRSNLQ